MPISASILLACRLWGLALAGGINVYAMIAIVGLASRMGWVDALPAPLVGLEQWLLIGAAAALFFVEIVARSIPWTEPGWETAHTVIRPVCALTLAFVGLEAAPWSLRIAGSLAAGCAALASHGAKIGLRLSFPMLRGWRVAVIIAEAALACGLALAALASAAVAIASLVLAAGLTAFVGPAFWRAALFAARAMLARLRGFFGGRGWRPADVLPARLRSLLPPPEPGLGPTRVVRATLHADSSGAWRNGFLAFDQGHAFFLCRQVLRPRRIALQRPVETAIRPGLLADTIDARTDSGEYVLHLLKDGPDAEIVVGALQLVPENAETGQVSRAS